MFSHKHYLHFARFVCTAALLFAISSIANIFNTVNTSAATYEASISTSGSITLDVSPAGNGASVTTDTLNIISTCPEGYEVLIQGPTDTTLYKDGNKSNTAATKKINASAGTKDTPRGIIGTDTTSGTSNINTWGYSIGDPATGNTFTPATIHSTSFVGLNNNLTSLYTKNSGTTATGDNLPVYYGVSVDTSIETGSYTMAETTTGANDNKIVYSLVTNPNCMTYQVIFNPTSTTGGQTVSGTGTMANQRITEGIATPLTTNAFTAPEGYTFVGWNTKQDSTGTSYTNGQSVTDIATPGTTITLYAQWEGPPSMLDTGQTVNRKLKRLAGNSSATYQTEDNNITALVRSDTLPSDFTPTTDNTISTTNSGKPIYAWYDSTNKTIYYYSEATTIKMNQNSRYFFSEMRALSNLSTISSWDTSSVTDMSVMFLAAGYNATTFTLDLSSWNTSSVTGMNNMFSSAGRNATTWSIGDLSSWNTSSVTNMSYMFAYAGYNATTFTLDLSSWNTSSVTNMSGMFSDAGYNATTFTLDLSSWNASSVTDMSYMFNYAGYNATTFTLDLSSWDTSSVTNMESMFSQAGYSATTWSIGNLSSWDTSKVTHMRYMFSFAGLNATTFTLDLSSWNTSSVAHMYYMFSYAGYNATTFTLDLSSWDTSSVTNMDNMFYYAGYKATTWSVTIPKTNKGSTPIANTTARFYGRTTSIYADPRSGKTFTLAD